MSKLGFGLLLPHFGPFAKRERLVQVAIAAESYGFDSLWTRDHLVYQPHAMEDPDTTHLDPLLTLAMVAGVTKTIHLGTASLIPYRHPIQLALSLGSLKVLAGDGRVIAGVGTGAFDHEFDAVGLGGIKRKGLLTEQLEVLRRLSGGSAVTHEGAVYQFEDIAIKPNPDGIPMWLCGTSVSAARWAAAQFDGWLPGRITLNTYEARMDAVPDLRQRVIDGSLTAGAIPIVSPASTLEEGVAYVNWRGMLEQAMTNHWAPPASGSFTSPADLDGALIAGPPSAIVNTTLRYQALGLSHIVYDLRARFADLDECVRILGEEVLPKLRAEG